MLRYYFGSTGKAYKNSYRKDINGKKYGFDEDGKMLFGYVEPDTYTIINNDQDEPILSAEYYYGTNEDGALHTGWLQYTDALPTIDDADPNETHDYYWFYFNTSNGRKVTDAKKTINGKKYHFDTYGVMGYKWADSTKTNNQTLTSWYGSLEDGSLAKNKWIWSKPYEDAYLTSTKEDVENEDERWFRTDASGNLVKDKTKKINSKWYVFDEDGVMRTGLVALSNTDGAVSGAKGVHFFDMDTVTVKEIEEGSYRKQIHYFSEDEERDGSMKTGTMSIELSDDTKTFCFDKNTGAAKDGYDSSTKKIYKSGILQKAGDDKYKVKSYTDKDGNTVDYLVGTTGNVVKAVNKYKDANDMYYIYLKDYDVDGTTYQWVIDSTWDEDAAKKAVKEKKIISTDHTKLFYGPEKKSN